MKHFSVMLQVCVIFIASSFSVQAQTLNTVRQGLLDDIQQAQSQLSATQESISAERQALTRQINSVQNAVLTLREQAVAARRLADEETLSLTQIESRLTEWQNQSLFQNRLVAGFVGRVAPPGQRVRLNGGMEDSISGLSSYLDRVKRQVSPEWQPAQIVLPDGQLADADVLTVGPVTWYAQGDTAGLAERDESGLTKVLFPLTGKALDGLQMLHEGGTGNLSFDPTLSRTTLLSVEGESVLEHLKKGGIWIIPILAFALFASVTAALKAVSLARLPRQVPALAERLEQAMTNGTAASFTDSLQGAQAELAQITLQPQTAEQRDERLYACLLDVRSRLDKWLGAIALTAAISPLLGLLGTVSGMITTFKLMTLFGAGDAASVSAGISEALVTTEMGLVVAIPALIAHALMSRKVKGYYSQLESTAIRLSQLPLAKA